MLTSFDRPIHALVVGRGGIGAALAGQLAADPGVASVVSLSRRDGLDLADPATIAPAIAGLSITPDLAIIATGVLHAEGLTPEKSLAQLDAAALARAFAVNAAGPALLMQALLPRMARDRRTVVAALSARVGSISDNRLGGWHSYRASKAALNQLIRTIAIEHARRAPQAVVIGLHPGTVDTGLSAPFQRSVARLFTPEESAAHLLAVIDAATPAQSGQLLDWQGQVIPP